ncbi:MAG: ribosome maturation factor RimM [Pseudomonadota bacterium]|nr:ribosome maturation factor RimM [Pseudomonadota bacterium]HJO35550.1 ribosome maturation factor RimM [Gammaproteobacteria bacterium]
MTGEQPVVMGRFGAPHGVRGWVRVFPEADPGTGLIDLLPWLIEAPAGWQPLELAEARVQPSQLLVRVAGCEDREAAGALRNRLIAVPRAALPPPAEGEFYWIDLLGVEVVDVDGRHYGRISQMLETGANDVMVVQGEREHLIPFVREQVVRQVDLEARRITVAWFEEF